MTKIQANDTPDIAFIPQPGVVKDIGACDVAEPLDDVVEMAALEGSMVPEALSGTVDDELYGCCLRQRQGPDLLTQERPGKRPATQPRSRRSTTSTR